MNSQIDVIALAREAGLCFPDCHFLDSDPYADLLTTLVFHCSTEQEREEHLRLVKEEEAKRRERLHQLERFAALVIRAMRTEVQRQTEQWKEADLAVWTGASNAAALMDIEALLLEHAHRPAATAAQEAR